MLALLGKGIQASPVEIGTSSVKRHGGFVFLKRQCVVEKMSTDPSVYRKHTNLVGLSALVLFVKVFVSWGERRTS